MNTPPFDRTICDCKQCRGCCKTQPGYLIPGDVERIAQYLRTSIGDILQNHLQPGRGAVVLGRSGLRHVPTIVPRTVAGGVCHWLTTEGCIIHPVSPFGCAYFDVHMSRQEGDQRSSWGLRQIIADLDGRYKYRLQQMTKRHNTTGDINVSR